MVIGERETGNQDLANLQCLYKSPSIMEIHGLRQKAAWLVTGKLLPAAELVSIDRYIDENQANLGDPQPRSISFVSSIQIRAELVLEFYSGTSGLVTIARGREGSKEPFSNYPGAFVLFHFQPKSS